jgi:hypothetical protein
MRYGYTYSEDDHHPQYPLTDEIFAEHFTEERVLNNTISFPRVNLCLLGFFQHDWIFKHFRKEIMEYLQKSPQIFPIMAKSLNHRMSSEKLFADFLPTVNPGPRDLVIHLRLEDYLVNKETNANSSLLVFSPDDYEPILKNMNYEKIYWVMKAPEHPMEFKYLEYLIKKWGGIYTPQSLEEDFCLMRKAQILICSRSTLSWTASYLSPHNEMTVFMPIKKNTCFFESCSGIYPHTYPFDYQSCTIQDLERIIEKE